jgi:predicted nucleic acid-binding protein
MDIATCLKTAFSAATMIATFCIENGFKLLQNDRDYEPFIRHLDLGIIDPPPCL